MLVIIANRKDRDQTDSSKAVYSSLHCLSKRFLQATSVQKLTTFTVNGENSCHRIAIKFVIVKIMNPFQTNGLFHKAIYNKGRMVHCIYRGVTG